MLGVCGDFDKGSLYVMFGMGKQVHRRESASRWEVVTNLDIRNSFGPWSRENQRIGGKALGIDRVFEFMFLSSFSALRSLQTMIQVLPSENQVHNGSIQNMT